MDDEAGRKNRDIRWLAVAISFLLSGFMVLTGWIPNEDAFTYIRTVEIFNQQGLAAAFAHYPWASYALLIAFVENTLRLDPFLAAALVNACFYGLLVYAFISLVGELDDSRRAALLAAVVVLVYPQLNENRLLIIRDSAFWALALAGLWQFLRYLRIGRLPNAIGFSACYLLAALFRVEALALLLVIPFSVIISTPSGTGRQWLALGGFTLASVVMVVLAISLGSLVGLDLPQLLANQYAAYLPFIRETFSPTDLTTARLGTAIFGEYAANFSGDYLPLFMLAGFLAVLTAFLGRGIGGPFLIVMLAGMMQKLWYLPRWQLTPLLIAVLANIFIALAFLVTTRFLSSRYVLLACLVLVVFMPLLLIRLHRMASGSGRGKLSRRLIGFLLLYCAVDAYISFGADKEYVREAGQWIARNSQAQAALLTNNRIVAYYSQRIEDYDRVPIVLSITDVLQTPAGTLIAFEEDNSSVGFFADPRLEGTVEEINRIGPEPGQQIVIYRRLQDTTN